MSYHPALPLLPAYIKKEDAVSRVKGFRKYFAVVMLSLAGSFGLMLYFVFPKMLSLYREFETSLPSSTITSVYLAVAVLIAAVVIALYYLLTPPDTKKLEAVLSKYKRGEMIRSQEIVGYEYLGIGMVIFILMVLLPIFCFVYPIYSLTMKF